MDVKKRRKEEITKMKEKTIYVSETNKIFDNKEDCIKEDYLYYITKLYQLKTSFFNECGIPIPIEELLENEENCEYIYIPNLESLEILKKMEKTDTILTIIEDELGLYGYNYHRQCFMSMEERVKEFEKINSMIEYGKTL